MKKLILITLFLLCLNAVSTMAQSGWLNYAPGKYYGLWTTKWLQADNTFYWKGDTIHKELLLYADYKTDSVRFRPIANPTWSPWYYAGHGGYVLPTASATVKGGIKVGTNLSINPTTAVLSASFTETDPTIYSWAKASTKPTYTYSEVGAQVAGNYEPAFSKNTGFNKNFGTTTGTVLEGRTFGTAANSATTDFASAGHNHSGVYEPAFSKNTGFNKNFGTTTGTVLEGRTFGTAANSATTDFASAGHNHSGVYEPVISSGTTAQYWRGDKTWQTLPAGMVYPGAGIPVSTGTAWGTSITNNSANWNTAYSNMGKIYLNTVSDYVSFNPTHFWVAAGYMGLQMGSISSGDTNPVDGGSVYTELNGKQNNISLTTTGTSGAATLVGSTLNIPQYADGNNYTTGLSFAYQTGNLTITRSGLTDLSTNLDGRYANSSHTHSYLSLSGGTLTGALNGTTATFSGVVTGSNFQLSDKRLKENIRPLHFKNRFDSIIFYGFTMRDDSLKRKRYGVIAQEVEKVIPELVYTDSNGLKAVNYTELLVGKMARMEERIKELEKRIKRLERHEK
jgi:hypothetical protein